jgi:hypothetical protein
MKNCTYVVGAAVLLAAVCGCQSMPIFDQPDMPAPVLTSPDPIPAPIEVEGDSSVITDTEGTVISEPGEVVYEGGGHGYCPGGAAGMIHDCPYGLYRRNTHHAFRGPHGPPAAQITYPYYTVRGPRCYFLDNPATIGP